MSAQHVVVPLNRHSGILKDEELLLRLLLSADVELCLQLGPDLALDNAALVTLS